MAFGVHDSKKITEMPIEIEEWKDVNDEKTIFSPSLLEKSITPWECLKCPWWLEYPLGVVPKCEQQLHAFFLHENPTIEKLGTTTILVDGGKTHVLPQTKSATKKGFLSVEEEEEIAEIPLIRKHSKKGETSKARSTISESIIQHPVSERMPRNHVTGDHYGTFVDSLLVDIGEIDQLAWDSINAWFKGIRGSSLAHGYSLHGVSSECVARLIFSDFPTSMLVDGINESARQDLKSPCGTISMKKL